MRIGPITKKREKFDFKNRKYKSIPTPMCRCDDCMVERKRPLRGPNSNNIPNSNIYRKVRNLKYKSQYKNITQISQELNRSVLFVSFNENDYKISESLIKQHILQLIYDNDIPFSHATTNGYDIVWYIDLPYTYDGENIPSVVVVLDETIEQINKEKRYEKWRRGYTIATRNSETGEIGPPPDYQDNIVNLFIQSIEY